MGTSIIRALCLLAAVGCISGTSSLIDTNQEPPGDNCANGGERVDVGVDDNRDGVLDLEEIQSTFYSCDGADAAQPLVTFADEPPGVHCATGGQRVDFGLDDDGNGTLDTGEVRGTTYLCDGTQTLLSIAPEEPGWNCDAGGIRVDAGADLNGNGTLDVDEITSTEYVCEPGPRFQGFAPAYPESVTFANNASLPHQPCGLAFDGTTFWVAASGTPNGDTLADFDANLAQLGLYQTGIDHRSVFTKGDGTSPIFVRPYGSVEILRQTMPGVFVLDTALTDPPDEQAGIVWDDVNDLFVANDQGVLARWDATGARLPDVTMIGFGSVANEDSYPQNIRMVAAGGVYMTYSEGVLSAWDPNTGTRLATTTLLNAGQLFGSYFSLSFADGLLWVIDQNEGDWRGYEVL